MPLLAIHDRPGSYSDRWFETCRERGIETVRVRAYSGDILERLSDVDGLLWHWSHQEPHGLLFARSIIAAAEAHGLKVFPNTTTCWHYDDKVAQMFLLQAVGAPLVPSYVFFNRKEALAWIGRTDWPKVFKLRRGAGSSQVKLVRDATQARALARKAFGMGFVPVEGAFSDAAVKARKLTSLDTALEFIRKVPRGLRKLYQRRLMMQRERGYFYLQDFLPGNTHDTRVTIIGDRAFAFRRGVRPGDFRASGSGAIDYDLSAIDQRCVTIAHEVAASIGSQSLAFDFVHDREGHPRIVEISYAYLASAVHKCKGYWDRGMDWHEGQVWPQDAILDDLLDSLRNHR